jgi:protease I
LSLTGKKVLILVEDGYDELEYWYPRIRLIEEGVEITTAGKDKMIYCSKHGLEVKADINASEVKPSNFDAIIIPGGVSCPDKLRRYKEILEIVKTMHEEGKVVAAICHGPWVLISAGIIKGRDATSHFSIKDDMVNAGANYKDQSVVVDENIVTSRDPNDLPDFCKAIIHLSQA